MYQNIKSSVSYNGKSSESFISEIGVRQGENLSPVLFSIYLNDLQSHLETNGSVGVELQNPENDLLWLKLLVLLYADDTVILANSSSDLQKSLDLFHNYCEKWHLRVNMSKTKVIVFGTRNTNRFTFKIGGIDLEITDKYHYLGLTFSSSGSFLNSRKHIAGQATKAMYLLLTKSNNSDLPIDLIIKLFDHTVLPILTYGSEIFGYENIDILEKVHNEFLRKITKARKSTPIYMLYGELGRYPISVIVKSRMIAYWNRLLTGKTTKLANQIYRFMVNDSNTQYKWVNQIRNILNNAGRPDLWLQQFEITNNKVHKQIKQLYIDQYKQTWASELTESTKGRTYNSFKNIHDFEKYFKILDMTDSLTMFKFRTANFKLPVEVGRYESVPYQNRTCDLCAKDKVGSEEHYIFECESFSEQRSQFLSKSNLNNINSLDLKRLLTLESTKTLKELCKFLKNIMSKFK